MIYIIISFFIGLLIGIIFCYFFRKRNLNNIDYNNLEINNNGEIIKIKSIKDLIDYINNIQNEIYVLSAALIALSNTNSN